MAKGKNTVHLRITDAHEDEALLELVLGPSGKLRAPALRRGRHLIVGFNVQMYDRILG